MKTLTFLVVIILFLGLRASLAQERQAHWLIGRWDGMIEGYSGKDGPNRTLRVMDVTPNGKGQATWNVSSKNPNLGRAELMVEGVKVKIVTGSKSVVELTRQGDDSLVGSFTGPSGRQFPIRLTKDKPSSEFDGQWEGEAVTRPCAQSAAAFFLDGNYHLTIQNSLITGYGLFRVHDPYPGSKFRRSTVTGQVESDGVAVLVQQGYTNTNILGTFTGTELRGSVTRGFCAYDVKLMRK